MTINNFNNGPQNQAPQTANGNLANNSGQGKDSPVLDIVAKRFNWGAFFLNWIWGLGNRTYITLLALVAAVFGFIPFIGGLISLGLCIWFGIKGNTWAWQNKKWQSVEHFHAVQKNWAIAGLIVFLFFCVIIPIIILSLTMPVLMKDTTSLENSAQIKRAVNTVYESVLMSEALGNKCELSSEGLAKCFAERLNVNSINGAELRLSDSTEWKFTGNNSCLGAGECYITIDVNGAEGPNADGKDIATIPLYAKSDGNLEIKSEDLDKYMN